MTTKNATKKNVKATSVKASAKKSVKASPAKSPVVKKASKSKVAEAPAEKKKPLKQLLPGGVVTAEIVTKKGNKIVGKETIRLPQKAAMTLHALQLAKEPLAKAALFAAIVKLYGIETSQDGFRVNEQCHALELGGLATMSRIEGGGAAQFRSATERGMSAVLPEISRIG